MSLSVGFRSFFHPPHDALYQSHLRNRDVARLAAVVGAVVVDVAFLLIASAIGAYLRYGDPLSGEGKVFLFMILPAYLFASLTYGGYSLLTLANPARSCISADAALLTAAAFAFTAAFALQMSSRFSRLEVGYLLLLGAVLIAGGRLLGALWLGSWRHAIDECTFVLGDETARSHARLADRLIDVRRQNWTPASQDPAFLDLVCRTFQHADRVLLIFEDPEERFAWASFMRLTGINAETLEPQLTKIVPSGIGRWAEMPTLVISRGPLSLPERVAKRALDLACVVFLAPVIVPLVASLALLVKLESPGSCFFVQDRVGRKNGFYRCYKLRTMRADAADKNGTRSASRDDDRITRVGSFLRKTSLDELPQLWNVFKGEMSLVGPRPHPTGATADGLLFWDLVDGYWTRHAVKPGITGLAQIRGLRGAALRRHDIEARVAADLEYINSWSIWLDLRILLATPFRMVHRNAF
jgi:polysaccharide biosynthesis protein PslA